MQCDHTAITKQNLSTLGAHFTCSQCDYKVTQKGNIKVHVESFHELVGYPCRQCDYEVTQKGNLKVHVESSHELVCYPCRQCDYKAT